MNANLFFIFYVWFFVCCNNIFVVFLRVAKIHKNIISSFLFCIIYHCAAVNWNGVGHVLRSAGLCLREVWDVLSVPALCLCIPAGRLQRLALRLQRRAGRLEKWRMRCVSVCTAGNKKGTECDVSPCLFVCIYATPASVVISRFCGCS